MEFQDNHPLEKWMSKEDFHTVRPHVKYPKTKNVTTDLANLLREEHVEIKLAMEAVFDDPIHDEGDEMDDQLCRYKVQYGCHFQGKKTKTNIEFSLCEHHFPGPKLISARDILLRRLTSLCTSVKRLTVHSSLTGLPSDPDFQEEIRESFSEWADLGLILKSFSDAAFWAASLHQLELLGATVLPQSDNLDEVLPIKPRNLKVLRLECDDFDDEEDAHFKAKVFVAAFPTLDTLRLYCRQGQQPYNFHLPKFFMGLGSRNPNLKTLQIKGDDEAIHLGGFSFVKLVFELPKMHRLENLSIDLEGDQKYQAYYADVALSVLKLTTIREISLLGIKAGRNCFDILIDYLSQEDCKLRFFDIDKGEMQSEQLEKLVDLLSLEEIKLPYKADLKTMDTLLILRRFQEVIPTTNFNLTTKLWPLLLANAGQRKSLKGMSKDAASRWFFSQDQIAPTLLYSLIRARVDVTSAYVGSKRDEEEGNKAKRPCRGEPVSGKKAKTEVA